MIGVASYENIGTSVTMRNPHREFLSTDKTNFNVGQLLHTAFKIRGYTQVRVVLYRIPFK